MPTTVAPRVLVVDDDRGMREALRDLLEDEGMVVVGEAGDGQTGVRMSRELRPDVVIMDVRMPEMGGIEATRLIRQALPGTQVIVLSVYEDRSLFDDALEAGAYAYLVKGGAPWTVVGAVLAACGSARGVSEQRAQAQPSRGGGGAAP